VVVGKAMFISLSPLIFSIDSIDRITIALTIAGTVMLLGAVLSMRRLQGI
jgi:hypothetical protein